MLWPAPAVAVPLDSLDPPAARAQRDALIARIAIAGAVRDPRVLEAMRSVPRHLFVSDLHARSAYADHPLPIGWDQTISQPTVVGMMSEALELAGTERVLEIGTGSGYQAAILSLLARRVFSIERIPALAHAAASTLARLGYGNVSCRVGDGYAGWPEEAPFDRIVITAAPPAIPEALLAQLAERGLLVAPVGDDGKQSLLCARKIGGEIELRDLGEVSFVPMLPGEEEGTSWT